MNHDLSYLRSEYAREKMIESYRNEEREKTPAGQRENKPLNESIGVVNPLPPVGNNYKGEGNGK